MKSGGYRYLFVLIFLISLIPSQSVDAKVNSNAEGGVNQCYSLDVVFLIDQSSSMSEFAWATDPTEQRKYAVQAAIDQLSDNALDRCPNAIHRIAIVSFGTEINTDLEYGEINPETIDEAIVIRERLKANVLAYNLGQTQPYEAFVEAKRIFDTGLSFVTAPTDAGLRKRIIVYITDGIPYPSKGGAVEYVNRIGEYVDEFLPFNSILATQEKCLSTLNDRYPNLDGAPQAEINKCLSDYPAGNDEFATSTFIYGLFMHSDEPYSPAINDAWEKSILSHWGKLIYLSNNRQEVSNSIRQILSRMIGVQLDVVNCGNFAVNPYLKRAILTFFKLDSSLKVTLSYQDAEGQTHTVTSGEPGSNGGFDIGEYKVDGSNERYVINQPYPGVWKLSSDNCDGLDAYYDPVQVKPGSYQPNFPAEIPQYELSPFYDELRPFYLDYQIKDIDGRVVPEADDPTFGVVITATVTQPNGTLVGYSMEYINTDQLFRTISPIKIPEAGVYTIDLTGSYLYHPGKVTVNITNYSEIFTETQVLFQEKGIEFKVHPVLPFSMEIISPTVNQNLGPVHGTIFNGWPLPISPINFSVKFSDQNGQSLNLSDVLENPTSPLEAVIEGGNKVSDSIKLSIDPDDSGLFNGTIQNFDVNGNQNIKVKLISDFNEYYRPLQRELQVQVFREDGLWNKASTYRSILTGLFSILILWIFFWFLGLRNKLAGHIIVKMNGTPVRVLRLANGRNSAYFSPSFWQKGMKTCIHVMKVFGAKNPKVLRNPDRDEESAVYPSGSIQVKGNTKCDSDEGKKLTAKFHFRLESGMDQIACNEHNCSFEYLDKNADFPIEYNEMVEVTRASIKILPSLLFLFLLGIIGWFLIVMWL